MKGTSLDIAADNRARLKQLFPTVFTETRNEQGELCESIDFEKLKAELGTYSDLFESRRERYGMEWPGKKEALHLIQTISSATLKPCRAESVNFDTTQNLFIEGDNLEVLKLLQTSYYGKVKMIYIDPPYNTGKEFIYPDNFSESLETYLEYAGQDGRWKDSQSANAKENPRYHTRWLNMMYPRLYLARNLLRDDGVIFISIDDNEVSNLRKLCDEIFGEENFIVQFVWQKGAGTQNDNNYVAVSHEYILLYGKNKNISFLYKLPPTKDMLKTYDLEDEFVTERGRHYLRNLNDFSIGDRPGLHYDILCPDGTILSGEKHRWRCDKNRFKWRADNKRIVFIKNKEKWEVFYKQYLFETKEEVIRNVSGDILSYGKIPESLLLKVASTGDGTKEIKAFFPNNIFSYPKPSGLIKNAIQIATKDNDIILDFFAGSATTAHAVLDLNKQDKGNRKFILVQLPEPCAPESEAFKAGYKTIADIGKERIRRVINKLNTEEEGKLDLDNAGRQDRGFKVLKLDKSNFRQWQKLEPSASTERILEQLSLHIDHIDHQATPEDLLYEILLKAGFSLTDNIETGTITGKEIFSVSGGALLLCLEESVNKELIDAIIELNPQQFICLDSAFHGNDQLKANAVQTFNAHNMQKEKHNQILFKTV